jgi:hypothetical protein
MQYVPIIDEVTGQRLEVPDFTEEIDAGVELLNREAPGWYKSINATTLNLEMPNSCVLGQLAMTEFKSALVASVKAWTGDDRDHFNYYDMITLLDFGDEDAAGYGFFVSEEAISLDFPDDESWESRGHRVSRLWEALTLQWQERINDLRANDTVAAVAAGDVLVLR